MGISSSAADLLIRELRDRPLKGSRRVLTLGRQDIDVTAPELAEMGQRLGVELVTIPHVTLSHKPEKAAQGFISDDYFFRSLGFTSLVSADYSDYEAADLVLDLNSLSDTPELQGAFEMVIDGGTLEHVFHLPNALSNICSFLETGGRAFHIAPSSNYADHGFYMFSPTVFADYYEQNNWEVPTLQLIREHRWRAASWDLISYRPGSLGAPGTLRGGAYSVLCVAVKTPTATGDRSPHQRAYDTQWTRAVEQTTPAAEGHRSGGIQAPRFVKRVPVAYPVLKALVVLAQRWRSMRPPRLEVVRRYR